MPVVHDRHQMIVVRIRLIRARERVRATQGEVAKWLGVSRPTVSYIESGKQRLTVEMLLALCECYGVQPGDVLRKGYEV